MKKLLSLMLLLMAAVITTATFTACGDDDDDKTETPAEKAAGIYTGPIPAVPTTLSPPTLTVPST
jgi:hypothetical protein